MTSGTKRLINGLSVFTLAVLMLGSTMAHVPALSDLNDESGLNMDGSVDSLDALSPLDRLLSKAGPELAGELQKNEDTPLRVILTGLPHEGITEVDYPERAIAIAEMERRSTSLFSSVEPIVDRLGGEILATYPSAPALTVRGDVDLLQEVALIPEIHSIALDYMGKVNLLTQGENPPRIPSGVAAQASDGRQMIQADEAWAAGFDGTGLTVSVIDTGIDPDHEAFKFEDGTSRIVAWANCIGNVGEDGCDESGEPFDDESHGTHVAGIAVGSGFYEDPTFGFNEEVGVAINATIMAAKFLNSAGQGSLGDGIDALEWSFAQGADISQNSWGSACTSGASAVIQTVNQLSQLGMANVFAAGNSGPGSGTIGSPACAKHAIAVGAVDRDFEVASFSSRGSCSDPTENEGDRICPHLVALGVNVRAPVPRDPCPFCDPSGYNSWGGTSAAAPYVAGALAIAEQAKIHFDGDGFDTPSGQDREMLKLTALPLPTESQSPNNDYGWGHPKLLNILAVLDASDEAVILDTFDVSHSELNMGETTVLSFSVRNMGSAVATGDFVAELEHPDGTIEVLRDEEVSLGLLDSESFVHTVTALGGTAPGNYTFRALFDYSWTNGTGEEKSGLVSHEGVFTVQRIFLDMQLDGFANETLPVLPQSLTFSLESTGNAPAIDATLEFTVPTDYQFLPGENFDPFDLDSRYADPAPDQVVELSNNRLVLIWNVGDLPPGDAFVFTTNVVATMPDDHRLLSVVKFQDDGGTAWSQSKVFRQSVGPSL